MNILNDKSDINHVTGVETEQVQLKKQEHHLLASFLRTKGLKLFYYKPADNIMGEVDIKYSNEIYAYQTNEKRNGKYRWVLIDWEAQKCTVESGAMYFECLNYNSAVHRIERYQSNELKELCNLKFPSKEGIKFY